MCVCKGGGTSRRCVVQSVVMCVCVCLVHLLNGVRPSAILSVCMLTGVSTLSGGGNCRCECDGGGGVCVIAAQ